MHYNAREDGVIYRFDRFTVDVKTRIASLVAEIRHALDDPADDPRFIRTMHRFGYCSAEWSPKNDAR